VHAVILLVKATTNATRERVRAHMLDEIPAGIPSWVERLLSPILIKAF
jgi:hypothetical protein